MSHLAARLTIRPAEPKDDPVVGELLVDAYVVRYADKMPWVVVTDERKKDLRNVAAKRQEAHVLVAELEGRVVGTVALYPAGSPHSQTWLPDAYDLRHLAVAHELHGQGLSRPLLDAAEAWAWSQGAARISLHVRTGNHGVAGLYQSRGYRRDPSGDRELPAVSLDGYVLARPTHK